MRYAKIKQLVYFRGRLHSPHPTGFCFPFFLLGMSDPPADIYEEDENGEVRGRGRGRVNQERGGGAVIDNSNRRKTLA